MEAYASAYFAFQTSDPYVCAMWLWLALVTIMIQFTLPYASSDATQLVLAAVEGRTTGLQMQRSNALYQYTILLNKTGQDVLIEFSTSAYKAVVNDVRYANGGSGSDLCTISIDDSVVGTFTTSVQRSPESFDPWNDFISTGRVGNATILSGESHTLQVTATKVDPYGMELDYVQLSLEYDGIHAAVTSQDHIAITSQDHKVITSQDHTAITSQDHIAITSQDHIVIASQDHKVITTSGIPVPTTSVDPNNATGWRVPQNKPIKSNSKLSMSGIAGLCVASITLIVTVVTVSIAIFAGVYYKKYKRRYRVLDNDFHHGGGYIDYGGGNDNGVRG